MIERSKSQWKGSYTMSLSTLIYLGCLSFSFIMTKHRWDLPQGSFATHWSSQKISCWWKEETLEVKTGCYFPWKKAELPQSDNSTCILHSVNHINTHREDHEWCEKAAFVHRDVQELGDKTTSWNIVLPADELQLLWSSSFTCSVDVLKPQL